MEFQVAALGPCRKKVSVKVPPERIRAEYDKQYEEINKNFVLPGFRKGRAPRKVLEKRFGAHLGAEVKEGIVKAAFQQLVEEKKVDPLAPPDIDVAAVDLDPAKEFAFEFELVTKPEFETPVYKGLDVKVPAVTVSDAEVQEGVDALRRRRARLEPAPDAALARGDIAVVDWQARSGETVEARDDGTYYGLGRGFLGGFAAEGLDAALEGQKAGAVATVKVHVPEDDPREDLRGKELDLVVTVKEVRRYVLPAVDAEFLKAHDYDDEAEMREDVRKRIQRVRRREVERGAEEALVEQLLAGVQMSLPPDFVARELETWAERRRVAGQMEKLDEAEIERHIEAGKADAEKTIERDMRRFFLLERIADAENVQVTQEEMVNAIQEIATAYGHPVDQVMASFREEGRLHELMTQIRHRKVKELIRGAATLVEQAPASPPVPAPEGAEPEGTKPRAGGKKK